MELDQRGIVAEEKRGAAGVAFRCRAEQQKRQLRLPTSSSSSRRSVRDKLRLMEAAMGGRGFDDDEEELEEEEFGKRDGSSQKELNVKLDVRGGRGGGGGDQKANTPRSKHSATEQRRRSKINDRFQILRDLIPHSDQKRDKASFLLEVIEYVQFLQEKGRKYESTYPEWTNENAKLMPWKNSRGPGESIVDLSQVIKNGSAPGLIISGNENSIPVTPMISLRNAAESDNINKGVAYKPMEVSNKAPTLPIPLQPGPVTPQAGRGGVLPPQQQRLTLDAENVASHSHAQWLRSCTNECLSSTATLDKQEDLTVDEGTVSISTAYSQGLLDTLTHALQSSGMDSSQVNISVQINLGKRAISRPTIASSAKGDDEPSTSIQVTEESQKAQKRHRIDNS
ncbi:Transcription factor BIM2 [Acorus calamus]|uniref:Transcription factor BIM2 n=1 Tax=Acorus calamus TaxID=4465 RepID=A0AAV9ER04_ACOCL|nr:Transcription factor BIM2 [Acorus calamus]